MNKKIACWGAVLALLAVVIGAFSAHTLKDIFTIEQMRSFETAVRYQMYHAIVLLIIGFHADRLKKITLMSFFFYYWDNSLFILHIFIVYSRFHWTILFFFRPHNTNRWNNPNCSLDYAFTISRKEKI